MLRLTLALIVALATAIAGAHIPQHARALDHQIRQGIHDATTAARQPAHQ